MFTVYENTHMCTYAFLSTYIFYMNYFGCIFFLKELCLAHKHQSFHFKSGCVKWETT